eukprot:g46215.t1
MCCLAKSDNFVFGFTSFKTSMLSDIYFLFCKAQISLVLPQNISFDCFDFILLVILGWDTYSLLWAVENTVKFSFGEQLLSIRPIYAPHNLIHHEETSITEAHVGTHGHPSELKKMRRVKRDVVEGEDEFGQAEEVVANFDKEASDMSTFFLNRGFPSSVIDRALFKVRPISRTSALTPSLSSRSSDRVPLILTYHPTSIHIQKIIR